MTTRKKSRDYGSPLAGSVVESLGDWNSPTTRPTSTGGARPTGGISAIAPPSVFGKGGAADPAGQYWTNLLSALGERFGIGQSDLVDFFAGIGLPTGHDISDAQLTDLNKQFVESLLSAASEQDARNYNQERLAEQRLYDNPQNQLARLMGAGISRDAAIQMLSGAGGSGSGSVVTGQAAPMPTGIPATQSDLNAMQTKLMPVQTAFGAISAIASAIGGLGSFGISAATLGTSLAATRAMTAGQVLSNTQLSKTLAGVESASVVISAISQAVDAGLIDRDTDFDSAQHMTDFIRKNAENFEPFNNLVSSGALDAINKDVYSLNALNAGYKSWRESRDYNIDRKHLVKMQGLEEIFKGLDIGRVNSEINLNYAHFNEVIAGIINSTKLANSQIALNEGNRLKAYAETSNIDAQTDLLKQQYEMQQYDLDFLSANIDDINSIRTTQLQLEVAEWNKMDAKQIKEEATAWLQDKQNQRSIIAIESLYYGSRLSAMEARQDPTRPATSDQNFANWVVYMHNLFSNALPNTPRTSKSDDALGALAGSSVARFLLKSAKFAL